MGKSRLFRAFFEDIRFIGEISASVQADVRQTEIVVHEKRVKVRVDDIYLDLLCRANRLVSSSITL